jgi:hypothetical protein
LTTASARLAVTSLDITYPESLGEAWRARYTALPKDATA